MEKIKSLTESGNAARFAKLYKDKVKYCHDEDSWYIWNGKIWEKDKIDKIFILADEVVKLILREAGNTDDFELRHNLREHATRSESAVAKRHFLFLSQPLLPILSEQFDKSKELVNVKNGIINLKTGEFMEHEPGYKMRKIINYEYHSEAQCPKWCAFINQMFSNDAPLINYIQKCLGLSLSGKTEKVLLFLCGEGSNGKSVFSETMFKLFNDYAQKTNLQALSRGNVSQGGDRPNSYLTQLRNYRLVSSNETTEGMQLDVALIKELTGGDTISARGVYRPEPIVFKPTHTFWMYGNHVPIMHDTSNAIWDRLSLIELKVIIPVEKRIEIDKLINDLLSEAPGILAWIVKGYQLIPTERLIRPQSVTDATNRARKREDLLQQFIDARCDLCEVNKDNRIPKKVLLDAYNQYLLENGERAGITPTKLTQGLHHKQIDVGGNGDSYYLGIKLRAETQTEEPSHLDPAGIKAAEKAMEPILEEFLIKHQ